MQKIQKYRIHKWMFILTSKLKIEKYVVNKNTIYRNNQRERRKKWRLKLL